MLRTIVRICIALMILICVGLAGARLAAHLRETHLGPDIVPRDGRFVQTDEGAVFVMERGAPEAPALLFVHGTGAWSGLWQNTLEAMAAAGYRAIAFDLTPFGFSERAEDRDYSRSRQAARIAALVRALEVQPIMVAHSFGAAPGAEAVMRTPESFAGLVLVAGAVGLGRSNGVQAAPLPLPLRPVGMRRWIGAATALNPLLTGPLLRTMLHQKDTASPEILALLQRPMTREGSTEALADWLPALLRPDLTSQSTRAGAWVSLRVPVALIWGREDRVTPPQQARTLSALRPRARIHWLEDVGHIPQIEAPAAFHDALRAALRDLDGRQ